MATPDSTTITLTRSLTRDQQERRRRLVEAARELAAEGGYAAVTMHDVADRAGVARATVYRYFTSKNHLLSEVSAQWITQLADDVAERPGTDDPVGRLTTLLCRIVQVSDDHRRLAEAIVQAATSPDPAAGMRPDMFHNCVHRMSGLAFGPDADPEADRHRHDVETVIGHVLLSGLVSLTARGRTKEEVQELMRTTVRLLLPPAAGTATAATAATAPAPVHPAG